MTTRTRAMTRPAAAAPPRRQSNRTASSSWLIGAKLEAELAKADVKPLAVFPQVGALVGAVRQLADRSCGGGDDARRQRSGEDVGAAHQTQDLELRMVGDAEAADRSDRL